MKQHRRLLPVLRLTEVTMIGNSLRLTGKILVLVKLMALTVYAKAGLLRRRTLPQGQGQSQGLALTRPRPRPQILALRSRTNITGDNWSCKTCKAPVRSSPLTNQHPVFLQARSGCPCCCATNSLRALKEEVSDLDFFLEMAECLYLKMFWESIQTLMRGMANLPKVTRSY